jgi:hypothetical protein
MLPEKYKALCRLHVENLWRSWRGLGLFSDGPVYIMGIEEALLGLCVFGRYDQRLFDEAVSLVLSYPDLINKNKISSLIQNADPDSMTIFSAIAELISSSSGDHRLLAILKIKSTSRPGTGGEPFFLTIEGKPIPAGRENDAGFARIGWKRNIFRKSGTVPQLSTIAAVNPWIRGKLIYGNSIRSDVILNLLTGGTTAPEIARKCGFTQKSVWNILDDFSAAGLVTSTPVLNKLSYVLTKDGLSQFSLLRPGKNAVSLWQEWKTSGHYIFHLKKLPENASPSLVASEEKRVENLIRKN